MRTLLVMMSLLALGAASARAQWLDPDRCWTCLDKRLHVAAGAVVVVAVRGPWTAPAWRNTPLKRVALTCAVGAAYEAIQVGEAIAARRWGPGRGFSPLDLAADCVGAAALELAGAGARRLF
jgi:hypothetical protein